ncbi:MAG TPA: hypothetical protein VGH28_22435 [Polyangiaceae bacterium]
MRSAAFALSIVLAAGAAHASLTPSEEVLVRQYVAGGQRANVSRVRAVVARPDLSADESAAAMQHALAPTPVTEARVAFLRELVFGPGSLPSRSVLAASVVRGLLARADAVFDRSPSLDAPSDAASELFRIYAFLDELANAGGSPGPGRVHDGSIGIDEATYESCAKAVGDHLKHHASALQPGVTLSPTASRIRAQAMLAAYDMGADSPTRVIDGADRIALDASTRRVLLERNVLMLDSGKGGALRISATDLVRRLPASALSGVEAIYFGDAHPGLRAHGEVIAIGSDFDATTRMPGFPEDEVEPTPVPRALGDLAGELSLSIAKRTLASHGDLRLAVQRDAGSAAPETAVATEMAMLLVDAPRALDLAMARFLAGRTESVALVSDAIGVLAASAGPAGVQSIVLGQGEHDGSISPRPLSAVTLAPNGTATGFTLSGARWEIVRDATGTPTGVHRDRQPLAFSMLQNARIPIAGGASWTGGGLALRALYGSPFVGVVHGPRVRIEGRSDLDAVAISAGDDVAFDADVRGTGSFAVLLRARSGKDGVGIGLRVVPGDGQTPAKIAIVEMTPTAERELSSSTTLSQVDHVHVAAHGATIRAICTHRARPPQSASLEAPIPAHMAHGDVAIVLKRGTSIELDGVALRHD